ncbi:MAG: S9 family peptidase [Crocinitomicaceae bacterium]|nr:S9 family peptidase [Crocinitomicaceae bacterium]
MRLFKHVLLLLCILFVSGVFAQKKAIDHQVYAEWKKNENQIISQDGRYIAYEINPLFGDGSVYLYDTETAILDSFPRGKQARFSMNSDYFVYKIVPGYDTLRMCELNKIDKKKWPKDSLGIIVLATNQRLKIPDIKSFEVSEFHNLLSYFSNSDTLQTTPNKPKKWWEKTKKPPVAYKSDGTVFTLFDPIRNDKKTWQHVTDGVVSKKGNYVAITSHRKAKKEVYQLDLVDLVSQKTKQIAAQKSVISSIVFAENQHFLTYFSSVDTTEQKIQAFTLINIDSALIGTTNYAKDIAISDSLKMISQHRVPVFSSDNALLFFGVSERFKTPKKDSLLPSEIAHLDIWHYKDLRIQPQQLVQLKQDEKRSDLYVYHLNSGNSVALSNDTLKVASSNHQKAMVALGTVTAPYEIEYQWESAHRKDHYLVSLVDGSTQLLAKGVAFDGQLSPKGLHYTYFNANSKNYIHIDPTTRKETCLTCSNLSINWQTDNNGMPMEADPYGIIGYSRSEDSLYIQSQKDVWVYSFLNQQLACITQTLGEKNKQEIALRLWENDSVYIDHGNVYFYGFDTKSKGFHLYEFTENQGIKTVYSANSSFIQLVRSPNKKTFILRQSTLQSYPEVAFTQNHFLTLKTISNTNPQQALYNWATVELVNWKSYDGIPLEGLLYKPENFDATKKYPLILYYYELNSDNLHSHSAPKPTASIIHPTEYASAGYLVFIPDIRYTAKGPAKSAYNSIMSGVDFLLNKLPAIDSNRMGLQGQSWGGYQTAQLITMTNRFKAAMAGAPVSNMTSAYGGIRWGAGINRQFQYERTQSRIGKTLWEAPEKYIENSPLFKVPAIQTPLLIMANDKDGAVPWYQGIEMYTAMRRLNKPCWMLNYNGDDHNLTKMANKIDLSIRMRQFFDHYLFEKPAPKWLKEGVPALEKVK